MSMGSNRQMAIGNLKTTTRQRK